MGILVTPKSVKELTPAIRSGYYFPTSSPAATGTSSALGVGTMRVVPWIVSKRVTLTRLGVDVSGAGEAGAKVRPVLYADGGDGYPGALVVDGGQLAADAVAVPEATVSVVLEPGVYWIGAIVQAVVTTQPTVRAVSNWHPPIVITTGTSAPAAAVTAVGYAATGVTGAPPATFPAGQGASGFAARIIAKAA